LPRPPSWRTIAGMEGRSGGDWYWITSLGLIAFGFVGMFSIGGPFVILGLAMLVLGPLRRRPVLFRPLLAAVIAANLGYWAAAPLWCSAASQAGGAEASTGTGCSSLIGIRYVASATSGPPPAPALEVALVAAIVAFAVVLAVLLVRSGRNATL
jgi:hypothetical protein